MYSEILDAVLLDYFGAQLVQNGLELVQELLVAHRVLRLGAKLV